MFDIASDYKNFVHNGLGVERDTPKFDEYISKFRNGLKFEQGKKYLKIIKTDGNQQSVWGFINLWNTKFLFGDILFQCSNSNSSKLEVMCSGYVLCRGLRLFHLTIIDKEAYAKTKY